MTELEAIVRWYHLECEFSKKKVGNPGRYSWVNIGYYDKLRLALIWQKILREYGKPELSEAIKSEARKLVIEQRRLSSW